MHRLSAEVLDKFQEGAADLEVRGTDWSAADAVTMLKDDMAAHVQGLEVQKVRRLAYAAFVLSAPVEAASA